MNGDDYIDRLNMIELDMTTIKTDIKWIKGMCGVCLIIVGAAYGIEFGGGV